MTTRPARRPRDLTWVVALAAVLWGTDAPLRLPLAGRVSAATIVFAEHVILVLVLLPFLPRAIRAFRHLDRRGRWAVVGIGAGASAIATTLFTLSFRFGDPITPAVIQKLQPILAIAGAALLLHERVRARFGLFAVPALLGAWLLAFPDPLGVTLNRAAPVLLALGAAALWAGGTVLGRFVSASVGPLELTTLRFAIGLPTALVLTLAVGSPLWVADLADTASVAAMALIPGLAAMILYYIGLQRTAASRATLAELAFPLTAAIMGIALFGTVLTASQWIGATLIVAAVTALSWHESRAAVPAVQPAPDVVLVEQRPAR